MPQLYLFNPGHEMEILCGKSHYTPPYTVQKMSADLDLLPIWYGGAGSYTLVRDFRASHFISTLPKEFRPSLSSPMILTLMMKELYKRKKKDEKPKLLPMTANIWGISPRSIDIFKELMNAGMSIEIPEWKEEYTILTKRQTSALCLESLQEKIPVTPYVKIPEFFTDIDSIEKYVAENTPPFVVKTPFSSSGRGLYWIEGDKLDSRDISWINGGLKKQGAISIEPVLNKVLDFAAEFYSDGKGDVKYVGLSLFETQSQGQFVGSLLGSQETLFQRLNEFISPDDYMFLVEHICDVLKEVVGDTYSGYMGVDMFIYKTEDGDYAVHPFVELNLRYTMGLVAMQISSQFIHPESHGMLRIISFVYDAFREHQRMQAESPLVIDQGLIRSGYMSLCPVGPDTRYLAVINISE